MFRIIENSTDDVHPMQFPNAIVTICIGGDYFRIWEAMCRKNWQRYCDVHQFDLIVITVHLDDSDRGRSRSPSWEKLLVLVQPWAQQYDRIVWVDADIIISRDAPNILASVPDPTKVGICLSGGQMSEAEQHIYFERVYNIKIPPENARRAWQFHCGSIFEQIGAPTDTPMFNGGLLVTSPRHHATLLRSIYERDHDSRLYEQPFISAELSGRGLAQIISSRFNWSVHEILELHFLQRPTHPVTDKLVDQILFVLRNEMAKAYFLHFAGSMPVMTLLYQLGIHSLEDAADAPAVATAAPAANPDGDYVSPGLLPVRPDAHFPNMILGDTTTSSWAYLRQNSPHNWYIDRRWPSIGFLSRDEAHLLYNTALQAAGRPALEIGAFMGWSACHLALAGVELDVVDPLLDNPMVAESVSTSLRSAGVLDHCRLIAGSSPAAVHELAHKEGKRWNLMFIDGDHEGDGPRLDAEACIEYAADDCIVLFHDLYAPAVADGLRIFKRRGWATRIYNTTQVMGIAWRGAMRPVDHVADPRLGTALPAHLDDLVATGC